MVQHKAASMIGLAMKAGCIAAGELAAEQALRRGNARLVILAEDASQNTVKKFSNMAVFRHVPVCRLFTKEELGRAVGRGERSCLIVTEEAFARQITEKMSGQDIQNTQER